MSGDASTKYRRPGFSLFGLLLVAFGALLLLTVTGVAGLGVWFELARYWPVLLILIGIKLILAPRAPLVGVACGQHCAGRDYRRRLDTALHRTIRRPGAYRVLDSTGEHRDP